jgi:1,2-diacylglycerol 3-alpha-glucosyltransferase
MKIVMLCDLYDPEAQYHENLMGLFYTRFGHTVTVIASRFGDSAAYTSTRYSALIPAGVYMDGDVKVVRCDYALNILHRLRKLRGVREILESERPDMVFAHDIHLNLSEASAYKRQHPACRLIMDYHADYGNSGRSWLSLQVLHRRIRRPFFARYRHDIDAIFPVAPSRARFLHEVYGVPHEDMVLLPQAGDPMRAAQVRALGLDTEVRAKLQIPDGARVVFTGGRLDRAKRIDIMLDAFDELRDTNCHLLVVGDTPDDTGYGRALRARAAGNGHVHWVGWVPGSRVYEYLGAADVAVFLGGHSVLWEQAVTMGLPLIVPAAEGKRDYDAGYLNRHGNVRTLHGAEQRAPMLAHVLRKYLSDGGGLRLAKEGATRTASEILSDEAIVSTTLGHGVKAVDRP